MSDISQRTIGTYSNEDQRWIAPEAKPGRDVAPGRTITLDRSAFDLVTAFPNGFIPSGIVLAKVAATGLYIPYVDATTEVQSVGLGAASAGTVTIGVDGETTAAIAFNAVKATVQAALDALPNVDEEHTITVGGADFPGVMTFTYGGLWAAEDMPAFVVTPTGLTGGTVTVATPTAGGVTTPVGEATAEGFLESTVVVDPLSASTADIPAALYWTGAIIESFLPAGHGLDAAARADLANHFTFRS